jgi:hypothetical protein
MTDDHLLSRCERIATSTWSDALDESAITGVVTGLSQRSGSGRFAGYAVTAREVEVRSRLSPVVSSPSVASSRR